MRDDAPDIQAGVSRSAAGTAHDRYERRGERWLFVRRKHLLVYGADLGQSPLGLPPAEWPRRQTGWGTVPANLPSWRRFWGEG